MHRNAMTYHMSMNMSKSGDCTIFNELIGYSLSSQLFSYFKRCRVEQTFHIPLISIICNLTNCYTIYCNGVPELAICVFFLALSFMNQKSNRMIHIGYLIFSHP